MKLELLTNATVVDDAIRFIESKEAKPKSSSLSSSSVSGSMKNNDESKEPHYNFDNEVEQEMCEMLTNQVF
jgi:hypothetical protein